MKKGFLLLICLISSAALFAQEKMYIHSDKNSLGALLADVDSIYFSDDGNTVFFRVGDYLSQFAINEIDSISFGENSEAGIVFTKASEVDNASSTALLNVV